jgi:hypothetical protein
MFGWKKWTHMLLISSVLVLATVVSMATLAGAGQITLVDDEEGVQMLGGQAQSGCSVYGSNVVYCPTTLSCDDGTRCPNLVLLFSPGTGVNAKNVFTALDASCASCGGTWKGGYCAGNLMASGFDKCGP